MVIKMSGNNVTVHIICRMLHRGKFLNIPSNRQYNNSSRMLSRGSADTGTSLDNTVNLTVSLSLSPLFVIVFHITKGCFFCQSSNGSCLKGLSCAKNNLNISMCFSLIIPGKVQVNIRLLIPFKSQESFKRNVKSFFNQRLSAHRTVLIGHITPCPP